MFKFNGKKIIFTYLMCNILFLLFSIKSFSGVIEEQINRERMKTFSYCKSLANTQQKMDALVSDFYSADFILECLSSNTRKIYKDMILVLPNVEQIDKHFNGMINSADNIYVYLLDEKIDSEYFKNRSVNELKKLNIYNQLVSNKNINIILLDSRKIDLNNIFLKSLAGEIIESKFFKDNVYMKYKKITKNDYLKKIYE